MRIGIYNLHDLCENNTLFLSRAWRYFQLNGHLVSTGDDPVDLVFIGGCAVTDAMRDWCRGAIHQRMRQFPQAQFVVFGCLAAFPEGLSATDPATDGRDAGRLHLIPYRASQQLDALLQAQIPFEEVNANWLQGHVPYQPCMGPDDCYVFIAQGCVNDCSYCNIKKAKGKVSSRSPHSIVAEVEGLYQRGIRTITLLADDCGSYGLDRGTDLPELLTQVFAVAPDLRIKLYTVFPRLFLRQAAGLEPFFTRRRIPYLCLPAQSGSPRILGLMNRHYTPPALAEAVAHLRTLDPEVFVYTHFIFNFPTETWEDFEQSIDFARHFDHCVFIGYGENIATSAYSLAPRCDDATLKAKADHLNELVRQGKLAALVVPRP
jgi:tRNA A37 methylthiotransferase MiaB